MKPDLITPLYIARIFQRVANCLTSIESFAAGYEFEANLLQDLEYPLLFLETPTLLEYEKYNQKMTVAFSVLDRFPEGISGQRIETDIESGVFNIQTQTQYQIHEVLGLLQQNFEDNFNWDNISILPLYEAYQDKVYGWRVELVFNSGQGIDYCSNSSGIDCDFENLSPNVGECSISYNESVSQALAFDLGVNYAVNPVGTLPLVIAFETENCELPALDAPLAISWIAADGVTFLSQNLLNYIINDGIGYLLIETQSGNWNGYPNSTFTFTFDGYDPVEVIIAPV